MQGTTRPRWFQQAGLGAQQQAFTGRDVSQLGTLGAINQAQAQADLMHKEKRQDKQHSYHNNN